MNVFISSNQQLYYSILRLFGVVLLSLILITCGGGDSGSTAVTQDDNQTLVLPDFLANKLIGFVMDNEGELIPFASLGGASTGSVGMTTGAATPTASGWYEVRAKGYATSYTRASGKIDDITVISTSLTPVDAVAFHSVGGDATVVTVGDPASPTLEASFTAATFDVDAVIELTALDPGLLNNAYADKDTSDNLYINYPFVISARSASDDSLLQPASGQVVEVTLTDNGDLGNPPRLFWFDPDQGMWIEQHDAACFRVDASHVSCQLSHFSQHTGASDSPPPPSSNGTDHANAKNNTDKAHNDRSREMAIIEILGGENEVCGIFSQEVLDAFKQEIDAALAAADATIEEINAAPDAAPAKAVVAIGEAAKAKLADTAGRLQINNIEGAGLDGGACDHVFSDAFPDYLPEYDHPVEALKAKMGEVTIKLGNKLLKKPQCLDIPSFDRVIAESILLLGGAHDSTIALNNEFGDLLNKCNIWEGQIKYSLILPRAISITILDDTLWSSGAFLWQEYHDFSMVLHASPNTSKEDFGDFEGTDKVTIEFPQVEYREYIDQAPCSFPVYQSYFRSGQPNPGVIEASFTGNYVDGNSYVPDNFTAASNINIDWGYFGTGWEFNIDMVCVKDDDETVSLSDPYRGQLVEQYADYQYYYGDSADPGIYVFNTFSYENFLSIWEILDQGPTQQAKPTSKTNPFAVSYYKGIKILDDAYSFGLMDGMQIIMRWEIVNTDYTTYSPEAGH